MDYDTLNLFRSQGFSIKKIAKELKKSPTNVRYWLKKFNIKKVNSEYKHCPRCKEEKLKTEFYKRRNGKNNTPYCKPCSGEQVIERQRNFKQKCVDYKGGKCIICEYKKCNSALEFHHLNSAEKDFAISSVKTHQFGEKVKKELDKCILVCRNCHAEIHAGVINWYPDPSTIRELSVRSGR